MAKYKCKNDYEVFEKDVREKPFGVSGENQCPSCKSTWTEYIPYPTSKETQGDLGRECPSC